MTKLYGETCVKLSLDLQRQSVIQVANAAIWRHICETAAEPRTENLDFLKKSQSFFDNIKTRSWPSKHWLQHRHPQTISHRFTHLCWTHTHLASRCLQMQRLQSFFYVDLFLQSSIHFLLIQNMIHYHQNYSCDKESFLNIHILIRLLLTLSLNHSSVKGLLKWQCLI